MHPTPNGDPPASSAIMHALQRTRPGAFRLDWVTTNPTVQVGIDCRPTSAPVPGASAPIRAEALRPAADAQAPSHVALAGCGSAYPPLEFIANLGAHLEGLDRPRHAGLPDPSCLVDIA